MHLTKERLGGLLFLLLSLAYGYHATQIPGYPGDEYEPFTASTLPYALAGAGALLSLLLTHEEAEVKANVLNIEQDEDLDDLAYYDDEQLAMCGLEDFAQVLGSWRAFIRNEDMG